uniref:GRAM domain-containing protein n=1 Tax=Pundamilia nyererei TaxID=303518 RepID=A0A3B4H633_9CICH
LHGDSGVFVELARNPSVKNAVRTVSASQPMSDLNRVLTSAHVSVKRPQSFTLTRSALAAAYSCALLRDILLQGRLYISRNWLCFYANLFGKDIKVCIPVVSVRLVKKHKTAGLVPNGLAITMDTGQKYVFVSLLSRDSVYDVLRRICTHLQVNGKSLSLKQYLEEPSSLSMVTASSAASLLFTKSEEEPPALLRFFTGVSGVFYLSVSLRVFLLVLSSCYLAFRVCRLEQQLSFLSSQPTLRERYAPVQVYSQKLFPSQSQDFRFLNDPFKSDKINTA